MVEKQNIQIDLKKLTIPNQLINTWLLHNPFSIYILNVLIDCYLK